jgi:hypothetical protein
VISRIDASFPTLPTRLRALLLGLLLVLAIPLPLRALILDAGDGLGNETAPLDVPGWANVGRRLGGPTVLYLGYGWVLTAKHVGAGIVIFGDERYSPIEGTPAQIPNEDGSASDLLLFRIADPPDLAPLPISTRTPALGDQVILIGTGHSRGVALTIDSPDVGLKDGWAWDRTRDKRWGTNLIASTPNFLEHGSTRTLAVSTIFERIDAPTGTRQEAQAAEGDSGGALFARARPFDETSPYELAGVIFTVSRFGDQPERTAFYGNSTHSVDLSYYLDRILAIAPELRDAGPGRPRAASTRPPTPDAAAPPRTRSRWPRAGAIALATAAGALALGWMVGCRRSS